VLTLFILGFAVDESAAQAVTIGQEPTQLSAQSESARLSVTIVDLYKQGKYDEAIPLAKRVLEIERGTGPDQPAVAVALADLAELYLAKKQDGDARNLFQQAARIFDRNQIKSSQVSEVLERLGQISFRERKYTDAAMLLERSLVIREQLFGADSLRVADTLHELANIYQVDHQYLKSEPLYLRSITIKEKFLGRTDPNTVQAMKDYACLRVRNISARIHKEEVKRELTSAEQEQNAVVERASCWLYGFKQDCDKVSYNPQVTYSSVLNGRAVKLVQPPYPVAARQKRISGTVFIAVLIDEEGNVIKGKPVCGEYPELNSEALRAALASKFTPTRVDDRPVQVTGMITYRFISQ